MRRAVQWFGMFDLGAGKIFRFIKISTYNATWLWCETEKIIWQCDMKMFTSIRQFYSSVHRRGFPLLFSLCSFAEHCWNKPKTTTVNIQPHMSNKDSFVRKRMTTSRESNGNFLTLTSIILHKQQLKALAFTPIQDSFGIYSHTGVDLAEYLSH